jgi:hypothetical protein
MSDFVQTRMQDRMHVAVEAVATIARLLNHTMQSTPSLAPALAEQVREAFDDPWNPRIQPLGLPMVFATWRCSDAAYGWAIHLSVHAGKALISYDKGHLFNSPIPLVQVVLGDLEGVTTRVAADAQLAMFRLMALSILSTGVGEVTLLPSSSPRVAAPTGDQGQNKVEARTFAP